MTYFEVIDLVLGVICYWIGYRVGYGVGKMNFEGDKK